MRGIRIKNGVTKDVNAGGTPIFVHKKLKDGHSDFSVLFKPLLDCSKYNWAFKNSPDLWQMPWEWFEEEDNNNLRDKPGSKVYEIYNSGYKVRIPEDGKISEGYEYEGEIIREYTYAGIFESAFIKKFSNYVKDDWNDLFAILPSCPNIQEILEFVLEEKKIIAEEAQDIINRNIEWYFCNFDGLFWQFFSKNEDDIQIIKKHLAKYESVTYEDIPELDIKRVNLKYSPPPEIPKEKLDEFKKMGDDMVNIVLKMLGGISDRKDNKF